MEHGDFHIGLEFWMSGSQWRCTDVGTRVIVAIRIDPVEIGTSENGVVTTRRISRAEAEALGRFSGPPYGVLESVIDEDDREACSLTPDDGDEA
jgi:hypothetical protein